MLSRRLLLLLYFLFCAFGISGVSQCWAQNRTITIDSGDDIYRVSFDSNRISESKLREYLLFSPYVVSYLNNQPSKNFSAAGSQDGQTVNKLLIALPLELCLASDPAYDNCTNNEFGGPNFLKNAKVNLEKTATEVAHLRGQSYPAELKPIVQFLINELEFSYWIEKSRFEYYSTWNETVLRNIHDDIDPGELCQGAFRKLSDADSVQQKYDLVRFDWANCLVSAGKNRFGSYPTEQWNNFLKTFAGKETLVEKGPD